MEKNNRYVQEVYQMFLKHPDPVGSTKYWLRKMHGREGGYEYRDHTCYRKMLMALNILENNNLINAIRTNDATIWALPYRDYKTCKKED